MIIFHFSKLWDDNDCKFKNTMVAILKKIWKNKSNLHLFFPFGSVSFLGKILQYQLGILTRKIYNRQYYRQLKNLGIPNMHVEGEDKFVQKWKQLDAHVNPVYYRLFSAYCGKDPNIIPEDICRNVVEVAMNHVYYRGFYSDKNMFDKIFPKGFCPQTLLRKIQGFYYDENYTTMRGNEDLYDLCKEYAKIIVKPSVNSNSGNKVLLFRRDSEKKQYLSIGGGGAYVLTYEFLNSFYADDFIVQECLEQLEYVSQFCKTSVNTLRIHVYRSVVTDEPVIPCAIMRIGKDGSYLDNAHAGGLFIGVEQDGSLGKYLCDQYGNKYNSINGINFKNSSYRIPNFQNVINFAKDVARSVIHHRCLALDIMLDKDGIPKLIEFNIDAFSMWLFQFTGHTMFGPYTDEVINYCKKKKLKRVFWR